MVSLAIQMALESDNFSVEVFEIMEFPHLAQKYAVMSVPKTAINETTWVEGAVSEALFIDSLKQALKRKAAS
jgi:predicted DsbA family dithiol-disulfide isomerase